MLREMSELDLRIWFVHIGRVGTIDDEARERRTAVIAAAAMNGPHFVKPGHAAYTPNDFLPHEMRPEPAPMSPNDLSRAIRAAFTRDR